MPNLIKRSKQINKISYYLLTRILGLNLTEKIKPASTLIVLISMKEARLLTYCSDINAKSSVEH